MCLFVKCLTHYRQYFIQPYDGEVKLRKHEFINYISLPLIDILKEQGTLGVKNGPVSKLLKLVK